MHNFVVKYGCTKHRFAFLFFNQGLIQEPLSTKWNMPLHPMCSGCRDRKAGPLPTLIQTGNSNVETKVGETSGNSLGCRFPSVL